MSTEHECDEQWERVSAELRACRESQKRAWGDVDNATLGRYLAGEVSGAEKEQVERALEELPDLRQLTDLVRDVLSDCAPPVELGPVAPILLPFPPPRAKTIARTARRGFGGPTLRRRAALVAAACLLLTFGWFVPRPGAPGERSVELALGKADGLAMRPQWDLVRVAEMPRGMAVEGPEPDEEHEVLIEALRRSVHLLDEPAPFALVARAEALLSKKMQPRETDTKALANAAIAFRRAPVLCQATLGPRHPVTRWMVRNQANVYQEALNAPAPTDKFGTANVAGGGGGSVLAKERPVSAPPAGAKVAERDARTQSVRDLISNLAPAEVRTEVVPVLVQALREGQQPEERERLARALGELGPAARDAVPALAECLRNASSAAERGAVLTALSKIGPAARGEIARCLANRGGEPERRQVREVFRRQAGREGRVGIDDEGACFKVRALQECAKAIQVLAERGNLEVLVETVPTLPTNADRKGHARKLGARSVHVLLARRAGTRKGEESPAIRVRVSPALSSEGLSANALTELLTGRLSRQDYDGGLLAVVTRITVFANERRAKR